MSIKDNHNRSVTFYTGDEFRDKIDKLTAMIGKLAARESGSGDNLNFKSTKAKEEDKIEVAMTDVVMINEAIKIDIGQIVETGHSTDKIQVDLGLTKL